MQRIEMEDQNTSDQKLCQICNKSCTRYSCPRCGIDYCSVDCYKSEGHADCSESFYKQCVEDELKLDEKDPETRNKMMEILKRMYDQQEEEITEIENLAKEDLDSDDDDEVPDLAERLQNVDLDNADSIWAALTNTEKHEFEALLQSGDAEKLIPTWEPWWSFRVESKLIEDLSPSTSTFDYKTRCPKPKTILPYNQISKSPPADFVKYNLLNMLHAYAFTVLYFNGDHQDIVTESTACLLDLSNNLRHNEVFSEASLAVESVSQQARNSQSVVVNSENLSTMKNAVASILAGPEESNRCYYMIAALSDIHEMLSKTIKLSKKTEKSGHTSADFSKRFPVHDVSTVLPRDRLRLCLKKIEYYLSWVDSYGKCLYLLE